MKTSKTSVGVGSEFHLAAMNALIGRRLLERSEEETIAALCALKLGTAAQKEREEAFA